VREFVAKRWPKRSPTPCTTLSRTPSKPLSKTLSDELSGELSGTLSAPEFAVCRLQFAAPEGELRMAEGGQRIAVGEFRVTSFG